MIRITRTRFAIVWALFGLGVLLAPFAALAQEVAPPALPDDPTVLLRAFLAAVESGNGFLAVIAGMSLLVWFASRFLTGKVPWLATKTGLLVSSVVTSVLGYLLTAAAAQAFSLPLLGAAVLAGALPAVVKLLNDGRVARAEEAGLKAAAAVELDAGRQALVDRLNGK